VKEYTFGGFWRRVLAALIDQVILGGIQTLFFLLGAVAGISGYSLDTSPMKGDVLTKSVAGIALLYYGFCILLSMVYFTFFHGIGGRTPGKMAMSLKVMQASGAEMTPGVAFLRWVGYIYSSLLFFVGYIWIAFDRRKQGWHDKIAGTVVILKKEKYLDKDRDI